MVFCGQEGYMDDKIWETLFWNTSRFIKTLEVGGNTKQNNICTPD
jgi:hypothetical protein